MQLVLIYKWISKENIISGDAENAKKGQCRKEKCGKKKPGVKNTK